jgi:hypothetical protein
MMNTLDDIMVQQLRELALAHNMPSLDLIADRMKKLADLEHTKKSHPRW